MTIEEQPTAIFPASTEQALSHYRIVAQIGAGGMGEVYLAEDTRLDRKVALKLLPAAFTQDAERVRRFVQEAKAASALNHPNIITVYDIGESDAGRFIVMELVAGKTLREVAATSNSVESVLALGQQMAKALGAAHAAGITHRDIKPDNIMVRDDGYVKVLDFGLARLLQPHSGDSEAATLAQQTMPGTIMGTVAYMSPEQARGESVSHPSDVFALGIVLYELATKQHPFKSKTMMGYLHAITLQTPAPPQQWQPNLPAALNALLLQMLEKDASQRPTASEVAQQLQEMERRRDREAERQSEEGTLMLAPPPHRPIHSSPLRHTVGRETERHELRAAFNAVNAGRGSLLCVAGEPGIGKTTLVEDFLAELTSANSCTIARGRCSERLAGTEAYLPLLEALESLLQRDKSIAHTMKQLAPTWYAQVVPLSGDSEESARLLAEVKAASQERMKRELANLLQAVAQPQPLVMFFDDLHWADVSTIDLLNFLAGKFDSLRLLFIVTHRPSDMLLAKHPFLQIKPDLQARGVCRELLLEFLNEAEIAEYLALEFPDNCFPPEFPQLIHAKTEGSPLFMADLVRYLRDRSVIANTSGTWMLAQTLPDIERELPESVRGMIERKIAQLSEEDRKLLTAASVQGSEFDSAVLAQALNLDADEIEERLEKLERVFAFVKLTSEAKFPNRTLTLRYRFVHVLYQNALYSALRVTRKASLSAAAAQAMERLYGAQSVGVANELALLWETAREYERAADYFLQAARNVAQVNAHREAVQLARRGLEALLKLPETPERDGRELGLQLTLGLSLQTTQGWVSRETGEAFNRAHRLCQQMGDDPKLSIALCGLAFYHFVRGEIKTANQYADRLLQMAEKTNDQVLQVVAHHTLGDPLFFQGEVLQAREHLEYALAHYQPELHHVYLSIFNEDMGGFIRRELSYCLFVLGYPDQAIKRAYEAIALAKQLAHPFSLGGAHHSATVIHNFRREWRAVQEQSDQVLALSQDYALGDLMTFNLGSRHIALAHLGKIEEGLHDLSQTIERAFGNGLHLVGTFFLSFKAKLCGEAGQITEGLNAITEALALADQTGERFWEAEIWRIKGELLLQAAASNAQAEAERCYHQALVIARQQSAKALELRAATSLARLWQQQGKTAEARQMLAEIYGWFTEGFDTADLQEAKALLDELQQ